MSTSALPPITIPDISKSTDPTDKQLVIRQVVPDIITFSKPFTRGSLIPIGGRTTAVRLPTSEIFVYASTPLSPATAETLKNMGGEVKWIVTPDGVHALFTEEYTKAYPDAKAIGVKRFKEQKPQIKWAGLFGDGGETQQYGFEPHITLLQVSTHVNHEIVAIHHPSKTMIQGDMLFNLPPKEQYSRVGMSWFSTVTGGAMSPNGSLHPRLVGSLITDKALMKTELQAINKMDWDRIIPCHGDVIETGGKVAWGKLWGKYSQ